MAIATYYPAPPQYTVDEALDFSDNCALFKMDAHNAPSDSAELERLVDRLDAKLVVLCGAKPAYAQLARLRESRPDIRQMDWIFNTGPHFRELSNRPSCFDAILVENAAIRDSLDTVPGMGRVIQVASGVDLERFRPRGRAIAAQDSSLVVGYVGRLAAEKNPLGFIDLAEQLHTMMPPLRFVIYGEGPQLDVLKARVAASPARDAIHYKGFAPHPTDALADMDVMVLPSILDGRPAALMEANACGVPVIAAPVGGIPEMIVEGQNGMLAAPREVTQIAALLKAWLAEPGALMAMRARSRAFAEMHFARSAMLDRYEAAFLETLSLPARAPAKVARPPCAIRRDIRPWV